MSTDWTVRLVSDRWQVSISTKPENALRVPQTELSGRSGQAPVNVGGRFSRKAATPSRKSSVPRGLLELRLELELLLERRGEGVLEQLLRPPDGARRQRRPLRGDLGDPRLEPVGGDHLRDQAPVERLRGRQARCPAQPLEGARLAEQPVDEPGAAGVRHETDTD